MDIVHSDGLGAASIQAANTGVHPAAATLGRNWRGWLVCRLTAGYRIHHGDSARAAARSRGIGPAHTTLSGRLIGLERIDAFMSATSPAVERHTVGHTEIMRRCIRERRIHEFAPDWAGHDGTRLLVSQCLRVVETYPHDGDQVRREAGKPGVIEILAGARLAGHGAIHVAGNRLTSTIGNDALHHLDDLDRAGWVGTLLTRIIQSGWDCGIRGLGKNQVGRPPKNGTASVLHAVNQTR